MRYDNYLLTNRLKKVFFRMFEGSFTLPKMFVEETLDMEEISAPEEMFLTYLVEYEKKEMSLEQIEFEAGSICQKNRDVFDFFRESCLKNTIYSNKLHLEY